jgi:hypothetical protein
MLAIWAVGMELLGLDRSVRYRVAGSPHFHLSAIQPPLIKPDDGPSQRGAPHIRVSANAVLAAGIRALAAFRSGA